jgi:hypothetical protein
MINLDARSATIRNAAHARLFPTASHPVADTEKDRDAIIGTERRLEREENDGRDTTIARLAISKRYSAYAAEIVRKTGGDVDGMKTLTDRNNMAPLAWVEGSCPKLD